MSEIRVYLGDDLISTETDDEIRAILDYFGSLLRVRANKTKQQVPTTVVAPVKALPLAPSPQKVQPSQRENSRSVKNMYFDALQALGGSGTAQQVYEKIIALGFHITAKNPRQAVHTYLRQPDKFVKVGHDAGGVTIWGLPEGEQGQLVIEDADGTEP
jgi:hypothetical protein